MAHYSIVSAVYNVESYLQDFFDSLDAQTIPSGDLQVILVDDGSTDDSLAMCRRWANESELDVVVLSQPNAGQASARNAGLPAVLGDWVSFVDPDDHLAADYFERINSFLERPDASGIGMIAARLLVHDEAAGEVVDRHPMSKKFADGDRVTSLVREPNVLQLHLSSAVVRKSALDHSGLQFDDRVKPVFEDVHFIGRLMIANGYREFGLAASAEYYYRVRADNSSTLQRAYRDERKYTHVPRYGWLDLLKHAHDELGLVPSWVQYVVIYDFAWIVRENQTIYSISAAMSESVLQEFNALLREVGKYIDVDNVYRFSTFHLRPFQRRAIIACLGLAEDGWESVHIARLDRAKNMVEVKYAFFGPLPAEDYFAGDERVVPEHKKVQEYTYFGVHVFSHRTVWLRIDSGDVRVRLNGRPATVTLGWDTFPKGPVSVPEIEHYFNWRSEKRLEWHANRSSLSTEVKALRPRGARRAIREVLSRERAIVRAQRDVIGTVVREASVVPSWVRRRYFPPVALASTPDEVGPTRDWSRPVWAMVNRFDQAGDNAEHLYRHVWQNHPEIDAWFILENDAGEWERLADEGFQLVDPRTELFGEVMSRAAHYISSQADHAIMHPIDTKIWGPENWRFTFLQHGIMNSDISRWLNYKEFDIFVTATKAEYEAVVEDGPYSFSTHEVKLTGSPRHDGLLRKAANVPADARPCVMIMPTWRGELRIALNKEPDQTRHASMVLESDYMRAWRGLLGSSAVRTLIEDPGLDVVVVPHPMLEQFIDPSMIPEGMIVRRYSEIDNQEYMARARMVITDYSSITFDAALIKKPIVYYQFDRDAVFSSGHTYRPGYFDYVRDGFGEVVTDIQQAERAINTIRESEFMMASKYVARVQQTFGERDDQSSERVFRQISALDLDNVAAAQMLEGTALE